MYADKESPKRMSDNWEVKDGASRKENDVRGASIKKSGLAALFHATENYHILLLAAKTIVATTAEEKQDDDKAAIVATSTTVITKTTTIIATTAAQ